MSLEERIVEVLKSKSGLKAREIADVLTVDKQQVNSCLYGKLRSKVRQDKSEFLDDLQES